MDCLLENDSYHASIEMLLRLPISLEIKKACTQYRLYLWISNCLENLVPSSKFAPLQFPFFKAASYISFG